MTDAPPDLGPRTPDMGPQTRELIRLAGAVDDAALDLPTPCPDYAVRHLLAHLEGLAVAFRDAARKDLGATTDTAPDSTLPELRPGWRERLPRVLGELAEAWRDPSAWEGTTRAGGVELPGAVAQAVATDELVVHGWDLARATRQEYHPDPAALRSAHAFLVETAEGPAEERDAIFGPVVPVPHNAPLADRVAGLSGRDPRWPENTRR
ncbi:TIGR03086 family metal-binding protein [Streptomyces sp. NPDC002644]